MKRNLKNNWPTIVLVLLTLSACGSSGDHAEHAEIFTCPMHPTVKSDKPGTCPVCGMDLVKKTYAGNQEKITDDIAQLIESSNEVVISNMQTIKGEYRSMELPIQVQGIVTYDPRNVFEISSRVAGRLEKVYLKSNYQSVRKGEKIVDIYSPELITAQRELIFLIQHDSNNKSLIDAAKKKLELLGLTSEQIDNTITRQQTTSTLSIYSPYTGYVFTGVTAPTSPAPLSTSGTDDMSTNMVSSASVNAATTMAENNAINIREGTYVSTGQQLFKIVNTKDLRLEFDVSASQGSSIRKGDKLKITLARGATEEVTIDFIQPFFSDGAQFMKLRVHVGKGTAWRVGNLVNAMIQTSARESLWIPRGAVVDLGTHAVVFIKAHGVFKAHDVVTGNAGQGFIQVISGLASSDEIAANAQYLVDGESSIKTVK